MALIIAPNNLCILRLRFGARCSTPALTRAKEFADVPERATAIGRIYRTNYCSQICSLVFARGSRVPDVHAMHEKTGASLVWFPLGDALECWPQACTIRTRMADDSQNVIAERVGGIPSYCEDISASLNCTFVLKVW